MVTDIANQKILEIQEAINVGLRLKIHYLASSNAQMTQREILPKEIKQDNKHSYVIGYCYLRKEEREFRLDGIVHMEVVKA